MIFSDVRVIRELTKSLEQYFPEVWHYDPIYKVKKYVKKTEPVSHGGFRHLVNSIPGFNRESMPEGNYMELLDKSAQEGIVPRPAIFQAHFT